MFRCLRAQWQKVQGLLGLLCGIPSCRLHIFILLCLSSSTIDLLKEVLVLGNGLPLARSWQKYLLLMALVEFTQYLTWYRQIVPLMGVGGITPLALIQNRRVQDPVEIAVVAIVPSILKVQPGWSGCFYELLLECLAAYRKLLATGKPSKDLEDSELQGTCLQGMFINAFQIFLSACTLSFVDVNASASALLSVVQVLFYFISWRGHAAIHQIVSSTDWSLMIESRFVDHSCLLFFSTAYVVCAKCCLFMSGTFDLVWSFFTAIEDHSQDVNILSEQYLAYTRHYNLSYIAPVVAHWWFLWRFMLGSGLCKVGGNGWWNRTALGADAHYVNQPLPSFTAWLTKFMPIAIQRLSVDATFIIEIMVPFMVFGPAVLIFVFWHLRDRGSSLDGARKLHPRMQTFEGKLVSTFLERHNIPFGICNTRPFDILFGACVLSINAFILPSWLNKTFRIIAGIFFLLLMVLINTTGNFGNLGIYTAAVCALLWAPHSSAHQSLPCRASEMTSFTGILLIALLAVPFLYVHVGLSLEALNASLSKFEEHLHFPSLHQLMQKSCNRKRKRDTTDESDTTILQQLKSWRITAAPNKPFSGVSSKGRTELIFEVKSGHPLEIPSAEELPDTWQRVPFYFKPHDSFTRLPWLFFFPGANHWPRLDWISFFWRQFGSSHSKEGTLKAFMKKLWIDDPVLDLLLPPNRPRARSGQTFTDIRVVRCVASFGDQWGCMSIDMPTSSISSMDIVTLTRREKQEALKDLRTQTQERSALTVPQGFFSYAAGYGCYSNVSIFTGNIIIGVAISWICLA